MKKIAYKIKHLKFFRTKKTIIKTGLAALVILAVVIPGIKMLVPSHAAPAGFVTRSGQKLFIDGQQYKFTGINNFTFTGCVGDQMPTDAELDAFFASQRPNSMFRFFPTVAANEASVDKVVKAAHKYNQKLIMSLGDAARGCGDSVAKDDAWMQSGWQGVYKSNLIKYVTKYKDEPAIGMWEYLNEPGGTPSVLKTFFDNAGALIRSIDPNHLLETGMMAPYGGQANFQTASNSSYVDILSMHEYDQTNGMSGWASPAIAAANALNKPLIVGEFGIQSSVSGGGTPSGNGGACLSNAARATMAQAKMADYLNQPAVAGVVYWSYKPHANGSQNSCSYETYPGDPLLKVIHDITIPNSTVTPPPPPPVTTIKLMPLGDSITEGHLGGYRANLWNGLNAKYPGKIDFVGSLTVGSDGMSDPQHEGHSGYRIDQIGAGVVGWLNTYRPDVITLHLGTNDLLQGATGATAASRLDTLLGQIYSTIPVEKIVVAIPIKSNTNGYAAYIQAIPGLVSKYKTQGRVISSVDMSNLLVPADYQSDGIHPQTSGYNKMGTAWIQPTLDIIAGGSVTPPPAGAGSKNDSEFTYSGTWQTSTNAGEYNGDDHYSRTAGSTYSLSFSGTLVQLYASKAPQHGILAVSIDNGAETNIDLYAAARADQQLVHNSPTLTNAVHTIKVRVTGTKNAAALDTVVNADRIDVSTSNGNGDVNSDGRVNAIDLSSLISHDGQNYAAADFNHDGTVGSSDLAILLSKWTW